ncbi:MAG: cobalamin-binding protein [archaeon]|nr:cobalamin-binding protein [archaeon]
MGLKEITDLLIDLDIDEIGNAVKAELDAGTDPQEVMQALTDGMDEVGKLYEKKEYYLTELVLAGETMKEAFEILAPKLKAKDKSEQETVVVATVKGDNHDIGKNILISMLMSSGYNIVDLGMDTDADTVVKSVKETGAKVLALSSLLTMTVEEISVVDKALAAAGIRDKVKIIVGGAPLNMELAKKLGADDYADDAVGGVQNIKILLGGVKVGAK